LFPDLGAAAIVLEKFLDFARVQIRAAVMDPRALRVPEGYHDPVAMEMIEEVNRTVVQKRKFLGSVEHSFDITSVTGRRAFARLAYCSTMASVWGHSSTRELFEAVDYGEAWYAIPSEMASAFAARLGRDGIAYPLTWSSSKGPSH
jgi:hypothetical protein